MTEPKGWDIRPKTNPGDRDPDHLFHSVGYALTKWEALESALAELFDGLVASGNRAGFMAYISIRTSSARSEMLRATTDVALRRDADLQIRVQDFLKCVGHFGARRNEIAHGRVYDLFDGGFYFGPNNIARTKFSKDLKASYQWVAADVSYYGDEFQKLEAEAIELNALVKATLTRKVDDIPSRC